MDLDEMKSKNPGAAQMPQMKKEEIIEMRTPLFTLPMDLVEEFQKWTEEVKRAFSRTDDRYRQSDVDRPNGGQAANTSGAGFDGSRDERNSLSHAGVRSAVCRNGQTKKEIYASRNRDRDRNWDYYNPNLETLRHIVDMLSRADYIGPPRRIRGYYSGDLSKQVRKEWAILHRNSDGFDWTEDDFEI